MRPKDEAEEDLERIVDLLVTTEQQGLDTKAAVRYEEERIMQP